MTGARIDVVINAMAKKTEIKTIENEITKLNTQHELFCQLYVNNGELFGNATMAYAMAYNINIESKKGRKTNYRTAQVNGSRLLSNAMVKSRVYQLLNELMKDEYIDGELAKVIFQDYKLDQKVAAIREYNRVRKRVSSGAPFGPNIQINVNDDREKYR